MRERRWRRERGRAKVLRLQRRVAELESALSQERHRQASHAKTEELDHYFTRALHLLCIADTDGYFRRLNKEWEATLGYSIPELEGTKFLDYVHPDDLDATISALARLGAQQEVLDFVNRYRAKDGSYRWLEWRSLPAGNLVYATARDLTPLKQTEEALRRANLVVENSPVVVFRWKAANGWPVEYVSANVIQFGYTPHELMIGDTPYTALLHPDDLNRVAQEIQQYTTDGVDRFQQEYRILTKDGRVRWVDDRTAVERDAEGRITHHQGIVIDITERVRAAEALRASDERFRRLVFNSNDIITVTDASGLLIQLSGAAEKILGYRPEALVGTSGFDLIHPDDVEDVRTLFAEVMQQPGSVRRLEFRHRHENGEWVWLEAVATNLIEDAVVRGIVMNIRDVTERKSGQDERKTLQNQLQQAMKMEAVGRLAGGVAHDFNNLLTAITGNIELARMELNSAHPLMQYLDDANKAAESAASLTRQLLAFSRRQIIEPRILNLNDLVDGLRKMLARVIGEDIALDVLSSNDLGSVRVDPGEFEQVLVNLVVNARDAMPNGGRLLIETANVELDQDYCAWHPYVTQGPFVMLSVSDSGHGMSGDVKQHLFEPFFTTKPKGHGTGLGLATTFGIVKQAGGIVEVYSEVGHGTTMKIYLPNALEPAERFVKVKPAAGELPWGNETILLVEDNASVRNLAMLFLKRLGYEVLVAVNGDEALMLAEKSDARIDLLLTDVVMPGMNGRELAEQLFILHPKMKVLFCSGYTENVIVHHGVVDQQVNFIGKPYRVQALAEKVRAVLERE